MLSWLKDKIKGVQAQLNCIFCKIRDDPTDIKLNPPQKYLYEDEQFYVIHDISKASARQHILVITKKHIRSALNINDVNVIKRMKSIAKNTLIKLQEGNQKQVQKHKIKRQLKQSVDNYRFGFHIPPYNSIDHIHLHGFLLPFSEWKYEKIFYGWLMKDVDQLIKQMEK